LRVTLHTLIAVLDTSRITHAFRTHFLRFTPRAVTGSVPSSPRTVHRLRYSYHLGSFWFYIGITGYSYHLTSWRLPHRMPFTHILVYTTRSRIGYPVAISPGSTSLHVRLHTRTYLRTHGSVHTPAHGFTRCSCWFTPRGLSSHCLRFTWFTHTPRLVASLNNALPHTVHLVWIVYRDGCLHARLPPRTLSFTAAILPPAGSVYTTSCAINTGFALGSFGSPLSRKQI